MALKFLNKKGWHTGSLRNIENVWKAEQKNDAEQKKLEELRKQIEEERERSEFRLLQVQAGLVPKQERLDFLYDSGLAVGKGSSDGFKALEALPKTETETPASSSKPQSVTPGALFEEKPQSANDAWRKLHTDPLLLIRQREQEALSRIKNNPIQMAMIRKSVDSKKTHKKKHDKKEHKKHRTKRHRNHSSSEGQSDSENATSQEEERRKRNHRNNSKGDRSTSLRRSHTEDVATEREERRKSNHHKSEYERHSPESNRTAPSVANEHRSNHKRRHNAPKLSEDEKAARLREMQLDAELHEEQRWKRLKKESENEAREANQSGSMRGRNFLDAAQKSVYGAEKGGSSTIEESVRRRTHFRQGRSEASEGNAFRR